MEIRICVLLICSKILMNLNGSSLAKILKYLLLNFRIHDNIYDGTCVGGLNVFLDVIYGSTKMKLII